MKLIWVRNPNPALVGQEVKPGQAGEDFRGDPVEVVFFRPPHKPSSEGKVSVCQPGHSAQSEVYVGVIGAAWVDRGDQ